MRQQALFIDGVYESVLEEILKTQQELPEQILFLQPWGPRAIADLRDSPPSVDDPMRLYVSTTDDLTHVRYSGNTYRIRATGDHGTRKTARVKTYGDVIEEYEFHPESKCADASGQPSGKQTVGLLQRRHIRIDSISAIGKESNNLEEVEAGLVHDEQNVYTEYTDHRRDFWSREVVPALRKLPLKVWERESGGKSRRILIDARRGRRRPHPKNQQLLISVARKVGLM